MVNGILIGGYKYSYALTPAQAIDEAEDVIAALNGRGLDFPVFYDLEWSNQRKLGKQAIENIAVSFLTRMKKAGYKVGIYCNYDWYKNYLTDALKQYDCWIANYPKKGLDNGTLQERLRVPVGVGWQYSSKGKVSGISGNVDMDVFYKDYRGTTQKGETKMVKISNCGHDENGRYAGGKAGDQTGTEYQIMNWYSRPWLCVLRFNDAKIAAMIADMATKAARNNLIRGREDARWVCSYRIKNGAQSCNSFGVREKELRVMLADLINKSGDIQAAIEKYISLVEKNIDFSNDGAEINRLKNMILQLEKKKDKLLDLNLDGIITNSEYLEKNEKFKNEIQDISNKLSELESKEEANKDSHLKLKEIGKILNDLQGVGPEDITKTVLGEFLDKIVINPKRPQECEILFFLKTGDVKKKSIIEQDKQGCSEYFFLTIYPPTDPFCLEVRFPLYPSVSGTPSSFATSYLKRSSAPFASGTTALLEEVLLGIIHFLLGCCLF